MLCDAEPGAAGACFRCMLATRWGCVHAWRVGGAVAMQQLAAVADRWSYMCGGWLCLLEVPPSVPNRCASLAAPLVLQRVTGLPWVVCEPVV